MPRRAQYAPEDLLEIEQDKLRRLSSTPKPLPAPLPNRLEPEEIKYHKVTGNESIGEIAGMYGITPMALVGANPSMQGTPPAGTFLNVPKILPSTQPSAFAGAQAGGGVTPNAPVTAAQITPEALFNQGLGNLMSYVGEQSGFAMPTSEQLFVSNNTMLPKSVFGRAGGGVTPFADVSARAPVPSVYASEKEPTVEAAARSAQEERAQRENVYYKGAILERGLSLAAQDHPITGFMETGVMPTFVPGNMVAAGFLPMLNINGSMVDAKDLIDVPLKDGGYGGVWNPVRFGWDLPSTAPGAKLQPGMALNSQWQRFKNNNTVDLNVMPFFISNEELAIPGYQGEEWSNYNNLKKLGGVYNDELGGWIFPKSNNAPDNILNPSPSPSGGGSSGNGEPIYKPKPRRGGGGGDEGSGGGGGNAPVSNAPANVSTNVSANAPVPLNPENQKLFDKVLAREVDSETAIKQLEWFISSGYLAQEQMFMAQQELERLRIAKKLAMLSSYKTASNLWRIG